MAKEGMYATGKGDLSQEEIEYFKQVKHPQLVSEAMLLGVCRGKTVVDIGAGPSTRLGEWVSSQGGAYTAVDIYEQSLQLQRAKGLRAAAGDISALPFDSKSVDVAHARCVLMHVSDDQRKKAICEMVRITRDRAVFLEYDWRYFKGGPIVNSFRDFMLRALPKSADPYLGKALYKKVHDALLEGGFPPYRIEGFPFSRPLGAYYNDELMLLARAFHGAMRRLQTPHVSTAERFRKIIEGEAKKQNPEQFTPPDIVAVHVIK